MLNKEKQNILLKGLGLKKNYDFSHFMNISKQYENKISYCTYMTKVNSLKRSINQLHNVASSISNIKKNNTIIGLTNGTIKTQYSTYSESNNKTNYENVKNNISSTYGNKQLSIYENPDLLILFDPNKPETLGQKIYRYLDITGFLTRYNNRKEWILDLEPYSRLTTVMLTEYERKLIIFLKFHVYLLFVICMYLWYHAQIHFTIKPPCPKVPAYGHLDLRKRDFTWHGKLFFMYPKARCKDCRWLDIQCKKECFEKLKQEGHTFIINKGDPLSVPKTVLYPSHFH
ncbi:conserved protein, unknown function [Hepatocystis sp. ex Piliocolobus tephrosceles]|nr:conserved protein, unknown function [Hepatocystis sp. ex Piliocolobus tephrosceles]